MARHATVEAPQTALLPVVDPHGYNQINDLGRPVVRAVIGADLSRENADYFRNTGASDLADHMDTEADLKYKEVRHMLDATRSQLKHVPDSDVTDKYLPPLLGQEFASAKKQGARHATILRWLADESGGATDDQLYDFVYKHIETLEAYRRKPEVIGVIEHAKQDYVSGVEKAVRAGHYDKDALNTLDKIRSARVLVGDVWDTYIMGRRGYHLLGQDFVVIGQEFDDAASPDAYYQTIIHELDHLQFPRIEESTWKCEARTEHITQCLTHGQWGEYTPGRRTNDSGVYVEERELESALLSLGKNVLNPDLAVRAHTSPRGSQARKHYETALDRSWIPGISDWVDARVTMHSRRLMSEGNTYSQAQGTAALWVAQELWRGEYKSYQPKSHSHKQKTTAVGRFFVR